MPLASLTKMTLARKWINSGVEKSLKVFEASRQASEYIFVILKLVAGMALFGIVLTVVYQAFKDHSKISVKPFSVPETMQKNHKAAGSIIANIIKQDLTATRINIDDSLEKDSDKPERPDALISDDTGFFKGANIKLPETGITINDVVEFISGLFGRKTITGSLYEDNGYLYLQVEINGKIFTTKEALPEKNGSSLYIDIVEKMAHKASKNILQFTSEKYRLYYYCLEDESSIPPSFEDKEYNELFAYCQSYIGRNSSKELLTLQKTIDDQKKELNDASNMKRFVISLLSNNMQKPTPVPNQLLAQNQSTSLAEEVQKMIQSEAKPSPPKPKPAPYRPSVEPSGNQTSKATSSSHSSENASSSDSESYLLNSELWNFRQNCHKDSLFSSTLSNNRERDASIYYNDGNYALAESFYRQSIEANCDNPFAWANLGILLSDLKNQNFNPSEGTIALQIAASLKEDAGWIWHSLCVAEVYSKTEQLEQAINFKSCLQARSVEPGKQLIYDKLFYTAIADRYKQLKDYKQAFSNYDTALNIDPKRTCRLNVIVESIINIRDNIGAETANAAICKGLRSSYATDEPDPICEEALKKHEKSAC